MKAKHFALILIPLNLILICSIVYSIYSEIKFEEEATEIIAENVQKLKDIREMQIAYKKENHKYADNFELLFDFFKNGSIPIVFATGERPDSLTELEALENGIISRDTTYIDYQTQLFNERNKDLIEAEEILRFAAFRKSDGTVDFEAVEHHQKILKEIDDKKKEFTLYFSSQIRFIPYTKDKSYNIDAGIVEKGKVRVRVFEVSATYKDVLIKLDAENKKYDLNSLLKVGSMDEASLNGNWK